MQSNNKIPFQFTSPLTTMLSDEQGRTCAALSGEFYAKGIGTYDPSQPEEFRLSYSLSESSFKTDDGVLPTAKWIGNRLMNLEDAHKLIIEHLRKSFCIQAAPELPMKVYDFLRDKTEDSIHLQYHDAAGKDCAYDLSAQEFRRWLLWREKTAEGYWNQASTAQKLRDFSEYLCDLMDFYHEKGQAAADYHEHIGTL